MHSAHARRSLRLINDSGAISAASAWLRSLGDTFDLGSELVFRLDLCASELVANIVNYAFDDEAPHTIALDLILEPQSVKLVVADDGREFDPLSLPEPVPPATLEAASLGGLGVHLVRQFAEQVSYERASGRNQVTLAWTRPGRNERGPRTPIRRGIERRRQQAPAFPVQRARLGMVERDERSGLERRALGFISRLELFRDVPYALIEGVLAHCAQRDYPDEYIVLSPGMHNDHVALVIEGRLRVHLEDPAREPSLSGVSFIGRGECAGELSIIDGEPASAWVVAEPGTRLLLIDAHTFFSELLPLPQVARNLLRLMAGRMRRANQQTVEQVRASMLLERLQSELRTAREIQSGMLPMRSPMFAEHPEIECEASIQQAQEIGGDFFDAFFIDEHRVFVAIGDVCGKGMPAALLMMRTLTTLRAEAARKQGQKGHLERVMERTNRKLALNNERMLFASLFIALLDTRSGSLRYANAGHLRPVLLRTRHTPALLKVPRNPIAGIDPTIDYSLGETQLGPGDLLVLYTDGVTEALNGRGELYGEQRLLATLAGVCGAPGAIEAVRQSMQQFCAGRSPSDDVTLLALRYNGPA
ncbi:SpoIIE family protein phosphatase [Methyloversatilis thermotolerans]|uniref:SpoIIE family protein phosphatase n=1 Tax=Methyloversatilis thermotolerans TaxID=1346290 RepID=UPI0003791725|nr:SpoIIE family protein phosphatase [Methyloversatilis thermotolerans]